jgi:hypothetical protein
MTTTPPTWQQQQQVNQLLRHLEKVTTTLT